MKLFRNLNYLIFPVQPNHPSLQMLTWVSNSAYRAILECRLTQIFQAHTRIHCATWGSNSHD